MKSKYFTPILYTALFCVLNISDVRALDIPAYIEDPQDVSANVEIIIKENTPITENSEKAENWEIKTKDLLIQYAAQLYADALSIRANMVGSEGSEDTEEENKSIFNQLAPKSEDNTSVMQNEVKNYIKNISLRLMQIANLEASIGNLQGLMMIDTINVSLANKAKDEEEE